MWHQRIGSQVSNTKCSLLPGPIESEDGAEKQGWPRPSREENLVQLQTYWWCKYSFLNSGQISLTAQQKRKGNSRERNLGRAIQCFLLLTSEHVHFPKLGNVTSEKNHWLGFNESSKHSCKDQHWKDSWNSLLWPSTGNPTGLIFHITGGLTWLSVFLWEEPPWWTSLWLQLQALLLSLAPQVHTWLLSVMTGILHILTVPQNHQGLTGFGSSRWYRWLFIPWLWETQA